MVEAGHKLAIGGSSMIGQCIATATARIASDVGQAPAHYENPYLPDTRSELALPFVRRGLCFGALTVQDSARNAFLDSDVTVLQTMVDQLAGAIENARLFEAAQREIKERAQTEIALQISQEALQLKADSLTTLNMIADTLYQSLDYQVVMDRALDALNEYTPAQAIAIFNVDEEKDYMKLIASHGLSDSVLEISSEGQLSTALAGEAVRKRDLISSNDVATDERLDPEVREALSNEGLSTIFIVPIIYQNQVLGVLTLGFARGAILSAEKRETVMAVARTICLAMANARYVEQIQHEIAERKVAQEEARRLNKELEQRVKERTVRLEATNHELEAFTYSVSHDLRAPLRAIDGFSLALLEDHQAQLEDEAKNYLHRVRHASQRMGQLIDDLLMLSRVTRTDIRRQPVNMSEIARTVAAELSESGPDRQVEFVIQKGLQASGDPRLMTIVLNNLLGNAWKFTSKHARARIEFGYTEDGDDSAFFVRDDGAGFEMAYVDKLFGAFQRLHNITEFEGTGIGLATVQRIIHRHGGRIWAHGEVDHGATFYFKLG
jgi:signal transduction histidine kinase